MNKTYLIRDQKFNGVDLIVTAKTITQVEKYIKSSLPKSHYQIWELKQSHLNTAKA